MKNKAQKQISQEDEEVLEASGNDNNKNKNNNVNNRTHMIFII